MKNKNIIQHDMSRTKMCPNDANSNPASMQSSIHLCPSCLDILVHFTIIGHFEKVKREEVFLFGNYRKYQLSHHTNNI